MDISGEDSINDSPETLIISDNEYNKCTCCNILRKTFGIIVIIFGIIFGFYISSVAMMGSAGSSKSSFVGFLVQLIISFAITCGVSYLGLIITKFFYPYKLKPFFVSLIIFGVCYIISLSLF